MRTSPRQQAPPPRDSEPPPQNDAVIGRAFRVSVLLMVIAAAGIATVILMARHRGDDKPGPVTKLSVPELPERPAAEIPRVLFTDITDASGITFTHCNGARGGKLLPETMGGGVAFFDFDGDGDADLLFVNGQPWPWDDPVEEQVPSLVLYRNDGKGGFTDITANAGLAASLYGMGVAVGDYDNDGAKDLFVTAVGENRLFRNLGSGSFLDVTESAGVAGETTAWSSGCAWVDIDNDRDLDLFVCNYVRWSREIDREVGYTIDGVNRAYGPPMNFEGTDPCLYRNEGDGSFTDISEESGVQVRNPHTGRPMAKALAVTPVDLDDDGWMDLVVANDTVQNFVFHNRADGRFEEIGAETGLAFDNNGQTRGAMGIDAARYRNDEALGIGIGNFANEMTALYVSQNIPLLFSDEAIPEGVGPVSRRFLTFGLFFFDYDLDGRLDLLTANGHLEEEIAKLQESQRYAQPAQLFWNCGPDQPVTFLVVGKDKAGSDLFKPMVGRGSAYADIDLDGDLDVIITQTGGAPLLLRNDQNLGHHWIRLRLEGRPCNRDAIGASFEIDRGGEKITRRVMPTRSYLSQSEFPVTIGLGKANAPVSVTVHWPGGDEQMVENLPVDQMTVLVQP